MPPFTVYLLCYGDYPHLASRALRSILDHATPETVERVVVAGNACSAATRSEILRLWRGAPVPVVIEHSPENRKKYPVMRSLFRGELPGVAPLTTEFAMWFDDDSYIDYGGNFFERAAAHSQPYDMVGKSYTAHARGGQADWIRAQPWYAGVAFDPARLAFKTGGWWVLRSSVIREYDWPHADLIHRGGDIMLGQLCLQQGLRLGIEPPGVRINADQFGNHSESTPRGTSRADNAYAIGLNYRG